MVFASFECSSISSETYNKPLALSENKLSDFLAHKRKLAKRQSNKSESGDSGQITEFQISVQHHTIHTKISPNVVQKSHYCTCESVVKVQAGASSTCK